MRYGGYVYILTNLRHTTLYVGVTARLSERLCEHRTKRYPRSFTARYNLTKLVYYEGFARIEQAIAREKQLKAGSRPRKLALIEAHNPTWQDLTNTL